MLLEQFFADAVFFVGLGDAKFFVQLFDRVDQSVSQLFVGTAWQSQHPGYGRVSVGANLSIVLNDGRQQNSVAAAVGYIKHSAGFVGQAVGDTQ